MQEAMGKQVLSTRPSSAAPRFGSSKRSSMAIKTDSPGPGAYRIKASLGEHTLKRRERPPKILSPKAWPALIQGHVSSIMIICFNI